MILMPNQINAVGGIGIITPRDLRLERKISAEKYQEQNIEAEIIKIIDILKKSETYEQGIQQLHDLMKKHPGYHFFLF
jgi:hypothetical protein